MNSEMKKLANIIVIALVSLGGISYGQTIHTSSFNSKITTDPGNNNLEYVDSVSWTGINDVKVQGVYAYCASTNGLVVIDVSDKTDPFWVSQLYLGGGNSIDIKGQYVYIAAVEQGVKIVDISNPENPLLITSYETEGQALGITIDNNFAYVAVGTEGLLVLDISNPMSPSQSGWHDTPGEAESVTIENGYAYVADGVPGIRIFEIDDSGIPIPVGSYWTPGTAHDVAVQGNYAYVADEKTGVFILDISDPTEPERVGIYNVNASKENDTLGIAINGNNAYIANGKYGIFISDISEPTDPVTIEDFGYRSHTSYYKRFAKSIEFLDGYIITADGQFGLTIFDVGYLLSFETIETPDEALGLARKDDYLFAACDRGGLQVLDISDPMDSEIVFSYAHNRPDKVAVDGHYAYIGGYRKLQILDIEDPTAPVFIGGYTLSINIDYLTVNGEYVYITRRDSDNNLSHFIILRIIDSKNFEITGSYTLIYDPSGVGIALSGEYAFLSSHRNGTLKIDISDPYNPVEINSYEYGDESIAISGDYAYIACDSLLILDVNTLEQISVISFPISWQPIRNISVHENYCALAAGYYGFYLYNISDPADPVYISSYHVEDMVHSFSVSDIVLKGHYVMISSTDFGLKIIDIQNPSEPMLVSTFDEFGIRAMALSNDKIVAAAFYSGMLVIDIEHPDNPVLQGIHNPPQRASGMKVYNNYLYVADGYYGLKIIDIGDPRFPAQVGFYHEPEYALILKEIDVFDTYAYIVDQNFGLRIIDISKPEKPELLSLYPVTSPLDVAVKDNHAFVVSGDSLFVIDVYDPYAPELINRYEFDEVLQALTIYQDYLYLSGSHDFIQIFNIAEPSTPFLAGSSDIFDFQEIAFCENYAYAVADGAGLFILNISDITNPFSETRFDTKGVASDILLHDNYLFIADGEGGILVSEIPQWETFGLMGEYTSRTSNLGIKLNGDHLFLHGGGSGMQIVDISNSALSQICFDNSYSSRYLERHYYFHEIAIKNNYAYMINDGIYFYIYDISNPCDPQKVYQQEVSGLPSIWGVGLVDLDFGVELYDSYAIITCEQYGIRIFDVSDSENAFLVYSDETIIDARGLALCGDYLFFAGGELVYVVDISDPSAPEILQTIQTPGTALDITIHETYAYVADGEAGLTILDIANPSSPVLLSMFETHGKAKRMTIHESYGVVSEGESGIELLDINDPEAPVSMGWYDTPGFAYDTEIKDDCIYVADYTSVIILQCDLLSTSVEETTGDSQQLEFSLKQNTPNPFNPSTTISYILPNDEYVTITIYNMIGQEVAKLENSRKLAGEHAVVWDGIDTSGKMVGSGVYFYRIDAGRYHSVKKMLFLR